MTLTHWPTYSIRGFRVPASRVELNSASYNLLSRHRCLTKAWLTQIRSQRHQRCPHRHLPLSAYTGRSVDPVTKSDPETGNAQDSAKDIDAAKQALQVRVAQTRRGGCVSREERGWIEEAQVTLEGFGGELDFDLLEGRWRLIYTNAPDVTPIVGLPSSALQPVRVLGVFQQFSRVALGRVQNIIEVAVPPLTPDDGGAVLTVEAEYSMRSARRIYLLFRSAGVSDLRISDGLEAVLAPAVLPRTWVTQRLLLAIQEFAVQVPLRPMSAGSGGQRPPAQGGGGEYQLTFLDEDMLVGRAQQGSFVFTREAA